MNADTHIKIRRVLEQHRIGPRESGGVSIGELAELIEDALDYRTTIECPGCDSLARFAAHRSLCRLV